MKKTTIFKWSNEHQNSFEKLKLALVNSEISVLLVKQYHYQYH